MKKIGLLSLIILLAPAVMWAQELMINSFDAASIDTNYWAWFDAVNLTHDFGGHYNTSDNADSALGWIQVSHVDNPVFEGNGAMKLDWSAHNIESWGGYSKLEHWHPDSLLTYDFSAYDSIKFWYYVETASTLPGRVHFRLNLHDVSDSDMGNNTYDVQQCEYYYSFHYVLDSGPGWNEIIMPLKDGRLDPDLDEWGGGAFNRTGWSGIQGNDKLDLDKIKGFSFEFSISGAGEGDHATGTFIIDYMALFSPASVEVIFFNGRDLPSNVELYGGWGGGSYEIIDTDAATPGTRSIQWNTPPNDWAVWDGLVFTLSQPKNLGANWQTDSLSFKIKFPAGIGDLKVVLSDPDEDGDGPDLEFEAGYMLTEAMMGHENIWETVKIPLKDMNRFDGGWDGTQTQPGEMDSTKVLKLKILIASTAGVGKVVYLDEIWTGNPEIDIIPPEAPAGVNAIVGDYYNLIIWQDVPEETGEVYDVYASREPITDLASPAVDLIAKGVEEDKQTATHWLSYPLVDTDVDYYYAVSAKDEAGNPSETFGSTASPLTNTAKGIATISLTPPVDFAADGDLGEWDASGIMPFILTPETDYVSVGDVDDENDLTGTVFLAIDDDFLYIGVDVIDDVYSYGAGNWWDQDAFELFFGLYDQRGAKHMTIKRGEEPDYKLVMNEEAVWEDFSGAGTIYEVSEEPYYFSDLGGVDYVAEAMIPLDSLAVGDDVRFHPVRGMRIPIEITFHDNDGVWEGNLVTSAVNTDNAYQTPTVWIHTWIGDTTDVQTGVDDMPEGLVVRDYQLEQNYPNPLNPTTTIEFSIAQKGLVQLEVFNVLGQRIKTLVNENRAAGRYTVHLDASDMSSGMYFYRLKVGDFTDMKKMLLIR